MMAKIYLDKTSALFEAGDSQFACWEKEFKQRRNSRQELLNEVMRSLKNMIGRYQVYMAALEPLQQYFPSEEVEHLIITSLTKFKQRIEDALKIFGHTVVEVQAYE
jgi:hypothetical protein